MCPVHSFMTLRSDAGTLTFTLAHTESDVDKVHLMIDPIGLTAVTYLMIQN